MISHLLNIVYGIVFGVANIIPGVSGGTMMVVFGVYDKVVDVLTLKLSAIKKNIRFIVFFGIGAVIGRRQKNHAEMPFCIYPGTCAGGRNDLYK